MSFTDQLFQKLTLKINQRMGRASRIAENAANLAADQVFQELALAIDEQNFPEEAGQGHWHRLSDKWTKRKKNTKWFVGISTNHLTTELRKLSGTQLWGKTVVTEGGTRYWPAPKLDFELKIFPLAPRGVDLERSLGHDIANKLTNPRGAYRAVLRGFTEWYLRERVNVAVRNALTNAGFKLV